MQMMKTILLALTFLLCAPVVGSAVAVAPFGTVELPDQKTLPPKLAAAIAALLKGEKETALTVAREFVREQPRSVVSREILGAAALVNRQWREAERALGEAARVTHGNPGHEEPSDFLTGDRSQVRTAPPPRSRNAVGVLK